MPAATNKVTVHFKASGDQSLLRALKELAKAQRALNKEIKKAGTTLDQQRKRVELNSKVQQRHNTIMNKAKNAIAQYRNTLLLAAFAAGLFAKTVGKLTSLFAEQESAEKRLSTALGFTSQRLLEFASAMQQITTFGDEVTISVMAQAAAFTSNEQAIEQMAIAAQNLAVGRGIDLKTAMDLISKSVFSSTDALARYGITVGASNSKTEKFNKTMAAINKQFAGQASAQVDTFAGATKQLANSVGDLGEDLGEMLANALLPLVRSLIVFTNVLSVITPILGFATKLTVAFGLAIFVTRARMQALWAWTVLQTGAILKLNYASKVTISTVKLLSKVFAALIIIEGVMWLFRRFSKETEAAAIETVKLSGAIKDLDLIMAGLISKSQLVIYLEDVKIMASESVDAIMDAMEGLKNFKIDPKNVDTQLLRQFESEAALLEESFKALFPKLAEGTRESMLTAMTTTAQGARSAGAKAGESWYDAWFRKTLPASAIQTYLDTLTDEKKLLKDIEVIEKKLRQVKINNIAWTASIVPNLVKQNELLEAGNTLSGTALEIEKMKIEARARGVDAEQFNKQFDAMVEEIKIRQVLINIKKKDLFITSSFNKALVEGINNNARFAESFGNMIKKMAAQLVAHMATFILFKTLFPTAFPGAGISALQYGINQLTGMTLGSTGATSGLPVPTVNPGSAAGAMQGISLENQNSAMQGGSGSVVVNFSGNVMSQDFIENDAIPQIKEAIRRGADIGIG